MKWKPITNAFCPTGEGGGIDPSCGKAGTEKEPWQVPKEAYAKEASKGVSGQSVSKTKKFARTYHAILVRQAVKEGKTIPPEVLKDYPEFQK